MKSPLSLFLATTALTATLGLPAIAGMQVQASAAGACGSGACAAAFSDGDQSLPLIRVSGDDEDDGEDDGEDDDCDDDDDDDDDDGGCMGAGAGRDPAPAGTVAPPANGLFGSGAPPVAVTN